MDLNAVEMFVAVVQAGSLSAAASKTGTPLPTLSRRIKELERELDVQLLERSVRGSKLTDAGVRLYELASRGVEMLSEARDALLNDQQELKGILRVSLPPSFEVWWHLLDIFQARFPGIRLFVYSTERRIDLIADGIDVALRVGPIEHESMVARRLGAYRHVLVASPVLVERHGLPSSPSDLTGWPCGTWGRGAYNASTWRLGDVDFQPRPIMSTNDYAHLRSRAVFGQIVTELPPFIARADIEAGRLVSLLDDYPLPEQDLNLLYPSHRHPSSIIRAYLDFCQAYVQEHGV